MLKTLCLDCTHPPLTRLRTHLPQLVGWSTRSCQGSALGVSPDSTFSQNKIFLWEESRLLSALHAHVYADPPTTVPSSRTHSSSPTILVTYRPTVPSCVHDSKRYRATHNVSGAGIWITTNLCPLSPHHRVSLCDLNWIWSVCFSVGLYYTYKQ